VWWGVDREACVMTNKWLIDWGRIATELHGVISRQSCMPTTMACTLSTPPRSCRRLTHPGVHAIWHARRACMLHMAESWTIIIVGWAKHKQTSIIDTLGCWVTPTAEPVSVPYCSPMFDVQDVSRFYRCSISDVHIGRSLHICCRALKTKRP